MSKATKFIFFFGSVISSIGKGLSASSISLLLQNRGYSVSMKKLDPYLNLDPGTMSPEEHGEVFITDDGLEADLDLGYYERIGMQKCNHKNNITGGKVMFDLLQKERKGEFLGKTVQIIPHVSNGIKDFIAEDADKYDFNIIEIGGSIGDIEQIPFLHACCEIYKERPDACLNIILTFIPYLKTTQELKTRVAQKAVSELLKFNLKPDLVFCRSEKEVTDKEKHKIKIAYSVPEENIFSAHDEKNIYDVPQRYENQGLTDIILKHFNKSCSISQTQQLIQSIKSNSEISDQESKIKYLQNILLELESQQSTENTTTGLLSRWQDFNEKFKKSQEQKEIVEIAIISKYSSKDSYMSVMEAFKHAQAKSNIRINLTVIDGNELAEEQQACKVLQRFHGIMIPGGFGKSRIEGKINAIKYARENKIPLFGICLGMQLSVIEFARNVLGIKGANSTEMDQNLREEQKIVDQIKYIKKGDELVKIDTSQLGGNMRLGEYTNKIKPNTLAHKIYQSDTLKERHRHRYEVDNSLSEQIESKGACFSALCESGLLPEIFEIKDHPFFIACQFHPEIKSTPLQPSPLFCAFAKAAKDRYSQV